MSKPRSARINVSASQGGEVKNHFNPKQYLEQAREAADEILERGLSHTNYMRVIAPAIMCAEEAFKNKSLPDAHKFFPQNLEDMAFNVSQLAIRLPEDHKHANKIKQEALGLTAKMVKCGHKRFATILNEAYVYNKFRKP